MSWGAISSTLVAALLSAAPDGSAVRSGDVQQEAPSVTVESIRAISEEIRAWVRGVRVDAAGKEEIEDARGRIRRYDWDDPKKLVRTFTRKELCQVLVKRYNQAIKDTRHAGCQVTVDDCLAALDRSSTYDADDFRVWMGLHRDENRDQARPDDAYWFEPTWWEEQQCWRQDVVWYGEHPRRGWHCAGKDGLWGWDPKMTGHAERGPGTHPLDHDGQRGWKGAHAGYPFDCADGCRKYIIWILPKETYLESIDTKGRRIAVGLWDRYAWTVDPDVEAQDYEVEKDAAS